MKLARFMHAGRARWGAVDAGNITPLDGHWSSLAQGLAQSVEDLQAAVQASPERHSVSDCAWLKPFDMGARIFCIGINYQSHASESGRAVPEHPSVFLRTQESFTPPSESILLPAVSDKFDFEAEIAVIIGRQGRHIAAEAALGYVAGYTCLAENSVRDFQKHSAQVTAGKNFDRSGMAGPWVVTSDEIPDPTTLEVQGLLNGQLMQHGSVSDLIFSIPALVSYISQFTALMPGDVIATGTPEGVGATRKPPVFMKAGDSLEVVIAGVGSLKSPIEAETRQPKRET